MPAKSVTHGQKAASCHAFWPSLYLVRNAGSHCVTFVHFWDWPKAGRSRIDVHRIRDGKGIFRFVTLQRPKIQQVKETIINYRGGGDFVATFGVINTTIYVSYCSFLFWNGLRTECLPLKITRTRVTSIWLLLQNYSSQKHGLVIKKPL